MVTIYIVFLVILIISFITGCIIQNREHKQKEKDRKEKV